MSYREAPCAVFQGQKGGAGRCVNTDQLLTTLKTEL
jgi:hypothetical protein